MNRMHESCRPDGRWLAWIAAGVALEIWGLRRNVTLSHFTRDVLRTDVEAGRLAFKVLLAVGAVAFARHILDPEDNYLP